jgi:hypothetical protein
LFIGQTNHIPATAEFIAIFSRAEYSIGTCWFAKNLRAGVSLYWNVGLNRAVSKIRVKTCHIAISYDF